MLEYTIKHLIWTGKWMSTNSITILLFLFLSPIVLSQEKLRSCISVDTGIVYKSAYDSILSWIKKEKHFNCDTKKAEFVVFDSLMGNICTFEFKDERAIYSSQKNENTYQKNYDSIRSFDRKRNSENLIIFNNHFSTDISKTKDSINHIIYFSPIYENFLFATLVFCKEGFSTYGYYISDYFLASIDFLFYIGEDRIDSVTSTGIMYP